MDLFSTPKKSALRVYKETSLRYLAIVNDSHRMSNVAGAEPGTVAMLIDAVTKLQEGIQQMKGQTTMLLDAMEQLGELLDKQYGKFLLGIRLKRENNPASADAARFVQIEDVQKRVDIVLHNIMLWKRAVQMYVGVDDLKLRELHLVRKELEAYKQDLADSENQHNAVVRLHSGHNRLKQLMHKPIIALNEADRELESLKKMLWQFSNKQAYGEAVPYIKTSINKAYLLLAVDEPLVR